MVVCGIATACVGIQHGNATLTVLAVMVAGFCLIGGSLTLNGVISNFYPAHIRATGVGWALGVGRLGAIAGPLVGAMLIAMHIPFVGVMLLAAIPAILSGIFAINIAHPDSAPSTSFEEVFGSNQASKVSKS
ncbi:4-hydroxybenzoate transporter PcaK [compost metagenome]